MRFLAGLAPAKVNLGLRVLGRRPDGYHEIRTILQTISLADRLRVGYERGGPRRIILQCSDPALQGEDNLAARAAKTLLASGPWRGRVLIELTKKIPAGAGLGGGSSDAAAVLLALRRLLRPAPSPDLLFEVAAGLGADVPFFLVGGRAVGVGRGDEVYPLPEPGRQWMLLLAPEAPISTPEAYRELSRGRPPELTPEAGRNIINSFCSRISVPAEGGAGNLSGALSNDFEQVVFRRFPILHDWKKRLNKAGASFAMMSGSGSALFGWFASRQAALKARQAFQSFPGKVCVVRTLDRRSYHASWH